VRRRIGGPSLVVLTGRDPIRRVRPRAERSSDLRLLAPVVLSWPVLAFWGLLAPVPLVGLAALGALATGGLAALLAAGHGPASARPVWTRACRGTAAVCAVLSLLLMAAAGHRSLRTVGPVEALAEQHAVVTLNARVAAEPRPAGVRGSEDSREPIVVIQVEATRVQGRGEVMAVQSPVLVVATGPDWTGLRWGEQIRAVVRLEPAEPGDGVIAVARPKGSMHVTDGPGLVLSSADTVRSRFRAATDHVWPDARGLVPALVVGDTSRTPPDLTEAMLATGLSHLSAVSGTNVTLVLLATMGACGLLGVPRRWRPLVSLVLLAGFVILARPEPSVVRAAVMGAVGLLGLTTSRRRAGLPALAGAVAILLVWDPWLSRSYGFALSSVATLGLLVFARPWGVALARRLPRRLGWLGPLVAVPVAAQAVCAPIVVPLQGSVSLVAVVANLLAAPLVAPATICGVLVALVSVASVTVAGWLAWAAALPTQAISLIARACADAPVASLEWGESVGAAVLLAVLTVTVVAVSPWAWQRSRRRPLVAGAVLVLATGVGAPTAPLAWPPPGWVLVACDVDQGDGLVANNGGGHVVVIDTGPDPNLIGGCLDRLDVVAVDLVVLTHYHSDHVDGLPGVLEWPVAQIRASPVLEPPAEAHRVAELAAESGVGRAELRAGQSLTVGDLAADVWWPDRRIDAGSVANNGSVVLTLHVRGVTILLTGDVEREATAEVVREARQDPRRWGSIDVLKVSHHGSGNRDDRLLDLVDGRLALISVGEDNDYGHPTPSTLSSLRHRGFDVHRTDLEGDVAVIKDADGIRAVSR